MDSPYEQRPWLRAYRQGHGASIDPEYPNALDMLRDAVRRSPDRPLVVYFDRTLTARQIDQESTALAAALQQRGLGRGDRLAVYLQNVPQFVTAMVATWKAGGIMVSINPMNRGREVEYLLNDCGAKVLVCLENLYDDVARDVIPATGVEMVITTSELDYQSRHDERLFGGVTRARHEGTLDLVELVDTSQGQEATPASLGPDDVAFLTYTSGTPASRRGR